MFDDRVVRHSALVGRLVLLLMSLAPLSAWAVSALNVDFSPNPVQPGATSTMRFTIVNSGGSAVTVSGPTLNLPAGVTIAAAPSVSDTCSFAGNVIAAGATSLTVGTGGTVPAGGSCSISFSVKAPGVQGGSYDLTIPAAAFQTSDGTNPPSANATATLSTSSLVPVGISVSVPPHAIADSGRSSNLSDTPANRTAVYTLTNPNLIDLTHVAMAMPQGNAIHGSGEILTTDCPGATVISDAATHEFRLSGATIPAGGSCTIRQSLRLDGIPGYGAPTTYPLVESVAVGILTSDQGATSNAFSRSIYFQTGVLSGKTFDKDLVPINGTVTMTLPVRSYMSYPVTYDLPDPIPAGFTVTAVSVAKGSNAPDTAGWGGFSTICNIPSVPATGTVHFTGTLGATYANGQTGDGSTNASCVYTVTLKADSVAFGASPPSSLVKTLTNTLSFPTLGNAAGGGGSPWLQFSPQSATATVTNCDPNVAPCPASPLRIEQSYTDALGNTTPAGGTGSLAWGGDGYFTFTVSMANGGALSGLAINDTFQITPGYRVIVATPTTYLAGAANTCGGTLTATPGAMGFSLAGGSVPAGGSCAVTIPVHMAQADFFARNPVMIGSLHPEDAYGVDAISGQPVALEQPSTITLNLANWVSLWGRLTATNNQIAPNGKTQLIITIGKTVGTAPLSNADFVYDLTTGLAAGVFKATGINAALTTCGGNLSIVDNASGSPISAAAPAQTVHIAGITMADGTPAALSAYSAIGRQTDPSAYQAQSCDIALEIEETDGALGGFKFQGRGNFNNVPAVGDTSTSLPFGGGNPIVSVVAPSSMSITKSFAPAPAAAGAPVTLSIRLDNSSGVVVDLTGIGLTDNYPAGLVNTATPGATITAAPGHTCSGIGGSTLTAQPRGASVSWTGGSMKAGDVCVISVEVLPLASGLTNTLRASDFRNDQSVGTANFSQLLGTTQSIGVTKYFEPATIWLGQNSMLKIDLVNFFPNPIDAGSLSLTDTLPSGVTVAGAASDVDGCGISVAAAVGSGSIVLSGGSIPAGGACEIDVPVTSTTPSATPYVNTIAAGAMTAKIEGVTASNGSAATASLKVYAPIAVSKTVISSDGKVSGVSNAFTFTVSDCSLAANSAGASATLMLTNALTGSATIRGIVPDTCTISETAPTNPPANYAWTAPAAQTVTTTASGANAVSFTNLLNADAAKLTITKNITGVAASAITGALTFPFTVVCDAPSAGPYPGAVTVPAGSLSGNTGANPIAIPAGATNCRVSEGTLPAAPANYLWGTAAYTQPAATALAAGASISATIDNPLKRQTGTIEIAKSVVVTPSGAAPAINTVLTFSADCGADNVGGNPFTTTLALTQSSGAATIAGVPAGASCTVSETAPTNPPAGFRWGATPPAQTLASVAPSSNALSFVNALTQNFTDITVSVQITGGPEDYGASFPVSVIGTFANAPVSGITPASPMPIAAGPGTTAGVQVYTHVPEGALCSVSQGALPPPPAGYAWGTPSIVQPMVSSHTATIVNPLIAVEVPEPPTPVPMLGNGLPALLVLALAGVCFLRLRRPSL